MTFSSLSSVSPDSDELLTDLGIMYLKVNEVDRAFEKLQEANLKISTHYLLNLSNGFTITTLASFTATEPNANAILALGAILQTKTESEAAMNTYKHLRNIQDEGFQIWNNIGMCFYRKNKLIAVIFLSNCDQCDNKASPFFSAGNFMSEESFMALPTELQHPLQPGGFPHDSTAVRFSFPVLCERR